ncbi:hypothetical protein G5I_06665 [Acromyrmex echinatior]|uniref:Uncharacterized protein n=1 Tax=Acromyrmex echinatior TaxID=103372 RepID=F4WLN9_ACREC|nr:hypothetical protein G5I_06665 [Acromyrmex echinatior]
MVSTVPIFARLEMLLMAETLAPRLSLHSGSYRLPRVRSREEGRGEDKKPSGRKPEAVLWLEGRMNERRKKRQLDVYERPLHKNSQIFLHPG